MTQVKKFNQINEEKETWKDVFCNQLDCGKYWQNLHKDNFEREQFLMRSDALYIIKKAQAETIQSIIDNMLDDEATIIKLEQMIEELWKTDNSALGMIVNGKQIR